MLICEMEDRILWDQLLHHVSNFLRNFLTFFSARASNTGSLRPVPVRPVSVATQPISGTGSVRGTVSSSGYSRNDEIDYEELEFGELLGSGAFGEVYSGRKLKPQKIVRKCPDRDDKNRRLI